MALSICPGGYASIIDNILLLRDMKEDEYEEISERCIAVSKQELNFEKQMNESYEWLKKL